MIIEHLPVSERIEGLQLVSILLSSRSRAIPPLDSYLISIFEHFHVVRKKIRFFPHSKFGRHILVLFSDGNQ